MKKVIVRLTGGLGNQLHQYAYGLILSRKINAELYIDQEFLVNYSKKLNVTLRDIEINKFELNVKFHKSILSNHTILILINKIKGLSYVLTFFKIKVISNYISINKINFKNFDFIYLDGILGNWQDYKFNIDFLKSNLQISNKFKSMEILLDKKIIYENSVAIHVRRSDYLKVGSIHHVLGISYYLNAIKYFEENLENPVFFVFSDDKQFINESFNGYEILTIGYEGDNPDFFDFLALKKCKHHIIANSTFSWWASFLGSDNDSICIAPSLFLKNEEFDIDRNYPPNWIVY